MNLKSVAALAAAVLASSSFAAGAADQKCGAGTCAKKDRPAAAGKEASCSKKDASCSKKEAPTK